MLAVVNFALQLAVLGAANLEYSRHARAVHVSPLRWMWHSLTAWITPSLKTQTPPRPPKPSPSASTTEGSPWQPSAGKSRWGDDCNFIFLDIGSNRGVTVRKLFEPRSYPMEGFDWRENRLSFLNKKRADHKPAIDLFNELFPPEEERARTNFAGICVFGFEPNFHHTARLKALERCYAARGWRVHWFTETAVSDANGYAKLQLGRRGERVQEALHIGASIVSEVHYKERSNLSPSVQTIDLAKWVNVHIKQRRKRPGPSAVYAKLDIEGAEWTTLAHMLAHGALCDGIDFMSLEWHEWSSRSPSSPLTLNDTVAFRQGLPALLKALPAHSCNATQLRAFQDDSYLRDTKKQTVCDADGPLPA